MWCRNSKVILKDSTMREGLDVPGVALDTGHKKALLRRLSDVGVPEVEIVAPGHFERDLFSLKEMDLSFLRIRTSGLIYGYGSLWREQINKAKGLLDRFDILMPLSDLRPPVGRLEKTRQMIEVLKCALDSGVEVGAGFPHATQVDQGFLLEICQQAVETGANRITIYDTNGSSDPWSVEKLIGQVRSLTKIQICFHAHNDLGMATANSLAAVLAGADCLDVTVNGLGDRAGNASLEQVAVALHLRDVRHGLKLDLLRELSLMVEEMTHVPVSKLAPVVGDYAFCQKSPSHLDKPALFEPFDPALVNAVRSIYKG